MIEQFFTWWFTDHYILSTLFTPFFVMIWTIFKGTFFPRGLIAIIIWLFFSGASVRK